MDDVLAARVRLLRVTVRESGWSEQEEDVYAQGLLESRRRGCGRRIPARRVRVRTLRRQSSAVARGVPSWWWDRAERHPGDHRHPEEGSRRCLRQRLDTDPYPGCLRRGEPALHPGLPRSHAHDTGEACHPYRDEDLACPTALLRVEADPLRTYYGGGDSLERGLRHLPGDRHLRTIPHELRPRIRGLQHNPGPGEGPIQGPLHDLRGGDARPLHHPWGGQEGPPVPGQRTGPQGLGGLVRPRVFLDAMDVLEVA